jgi:hypothetical protein
MELKIKNFKLEKEPESKEDINKKWISEKRKI